MVGCRSRVEIGTPARIDSETETERDGGRLIRTYGPPTLRYKVDSYWRLCMPRWQRVIRGMIGMGLTFSAGVGVVASTIAGLAWLLPGGGGGREMIRIVVASSMWAFPVGVAFSGLLAITAQPFVRQALASRLRRPRCWRWASPVRGPCGQCVAGLVPPNRSDQPGRLPASG